ncbi:MAG: M14 family zinc carboxypeptidase [Candidatus Sumerlaeia bacterium]|nr:M14 family zinc carboxypeptidase [Candidatus Sumerlaeia bacterium]
MLKRRAWRALAAALAVMTGTAGAEGYRTAADTEQVLRRAAAANLDTFEFSELARDAADNPVWLFRAGPERPGGPAMLVAAGLDGRHIVGSEIALRFIERLADGSEESEKLLSEHTIYVVTNMNPAGLATWFDSPTRAHSGSTGASDSDHDGESGEDLAEDLDGDGAIRMIRVKHPRGTHIADGKDGAFARPADAMKGERGEWLILSEGRDNDGDERWNEEEDGAVSVARNFPTDFPWFEKGSASNPADQPQVHALIDFLYDNPQIGTVVVLGTEDNLLTAPDPEKTTDPDVKGGRWGRKPSSLPNKNDLPLLRKVAEEYRKSLGLKGEVSTPGASDAAQGGLARFASVALGRFAVATPVWTSNMQLALLPELSDEEKKALPENGEIAKLQRFRDWLVERDPQGWAAWKPIKHPDFPDHDAEAGGFAPHARIVPPPALLDDLATTHTLFLMETARRAPKVAIESAELKRLERGLFELRLAVRNDGFLPDVLHQGVYSSLVRPTRIEIEGADVLDGPERIKLEPLAGNGGRTEMRRVVHLNDGGKTLTVRLVSDMAGRDERVLRTDDAE